MSYESVLTKVQNFCGRFGLPQPSALVGATESAVVQYRTIMLDVVRTLAQYDWQVLSYRTTFTTIAAEDQGRLSAIIGTEPYNGLILLSLWDETLRRPLYGPITRQTYEMYKAFTVTGPLYQWLTMNDHLYITPAIPAGHTIGLAYQSEYGIADSTLTTRKATFTDDTDVVLFPNLVVDLCFEYKWKKIKGEEWETTYTEYMSAVARNIVKDGKPIFRLDKPSTNLRPGIIIPAGNWPNT